MPKIDARAPRPAERRLKRVLDWAIFCSGGLSLAMAIGLTIAGAMRG